MFFQKKQPVVGLSTTALNTDFITHRRQFKVSQQFISGMELALKRHDLFNVYKKKEKFILMLRYSLWIDTYWLIRNPL